MPRKAKYEDGSRPKGPGIPGLIRNPVKLPPMENIKDQREIPFDSDEDHDNDELLGDELAKIEEKLPCADWT